MRLVAYLGMAVMAAMLLVVSGQRAGAMDMAPALATAKDSAAAMHNSEGMKHYSAGHMDVAADHFRGAVKADDKSAEAHYNLALALDGMGEHKEASAEFKKALDLTPNNPVIANSDVLKKHLGMK
jgi:Flp pilus assembly protein TadD